MLASLDPRLLALRDWLPGQVLQGTRGAQYHVRERVGEGGQGWVFRANWDQPDGYVVIVKVLRPDAVTPEAFQRFEREAQVLRMLGQSARPNPHVVRFFDHATARLPGPAGGAPIVLPFTVLEYVRGPTLEHILDRARGTGLALDRTRRIARQVVLALEDVHAHKVVHRDLKPSNVLLATEDGAEIAKVTDFGLVKLVDVGLGRTTALAGASLGYAPPEQFEQGNKRVGPRTDVFSFAAMLHEMLTGVKAFPYSEGENPLVVVTRLLNGPRPSLAHARGMLPHELAMRPDLVEQIDALLMRATAAEPAERPATIGALWGGVEPFLRAASERPSVPDGAIAAAGDVATAVDLPTPPPMPPRSPPRPAQAIGTAVAPPARRPGEVVDASSHRPKAAPEADSESARPDAWTWRVRVPPLGADAVRAAVFDPGGAAAIAVGSRGPLVWEGSGWSHPPGGLEIDARAVRGIVWLRPGELLVFGARGLAARWAPGSALEAWAPADPEVTFLGAHVDPPGTTVTLVGERPVRRAARAGVPTTPHVAQTTARTTPNTTPDGTPNKTPNKTPNTTMGIIAQFARGRVTLLSDVPRVTRLRGVARLRAGELVACGDWGALVRVEFGVPESLGPICGGHLHAIGARLDGAITVGAGGHALSLSPRLEGRLEAVQTTRDLLSLAVDANGLAWAGSAQARVLRRTGGRWVRMTAELGLSSSVVALWAATRMVRAICDDGAVLEGNARVDQG
jgi:eukaryotic-like serine/threonine-protein kinase